jgi:hypothetical protein
MAFKTVFKKRKAKWFLFSISGLLLTGLGLSLSIEAGIHKANNQDWFLNGAFGLIAFNTGLSLFGRAVAEFVWLKKK